jgi:hypothetical protein
MDQQQTLPEAHSYTCKSIRLDKMEQILKNKNIVTYRNDEYTYNGHEVIDEQCIHLHLNEGIYAVTLPCKINTKVIATLVEFEEAMQ